MADLPLPQPGVLSDPGDFAEYLTFAVRPGADNRSREVVAAALATLDNVTKSIAQKDPAAQLSATIGFSADGWAALFPEAALPDGLAPFPELRDGDRHFPSTSGDVFVMVKSSRLDLNLQVARHLVEATAPHAELLEDIQGYRYLDSRDLIDFVDGTENPHDEERVAAVLVPSGEYAGGSHLFVQRYLDLDSRWRSLSAAEQELVIGRTKFDDIELSDEAKPPYAHNAKSKVEIDGVEIKMFRQNRAFGNAQRHGTMFIGFAADAATISTSLRQMITADPDGNYDRLLDFVLAETGTAYFVPPKSFLKQYAG